MWLDSDGNAIFLRRGLLKTLYVRGLQCLLIYLDSLPEGQPVSGIGEFDAMRRDQQIALLAHLSDALFDRNSPPPQPSAAMDAALAAICEMIRRRVLDEYHGRLSGRRWRQAIISETRKSGLCRKVTLTNACDRQWENMVINLRDSLVRDEEVWTGPDRWLDDPKAAAKARIHYDLPDDYFVAPPPDPTPEQADQLRASLTDLVHAAAGGKP